MSGVRAGAAPLSTLRALLRSPAPVAAVAAAVLLGCTVLLAGCTGDSSAQPPPDPPSTPSPSRADARAELAALAAAAQDRHLVASYTLSAAGRADRTVQVTSARDGTWRVDIPGGALGGTADVSMAQTAEGIFQCALPSAQRIEPAGCVRVGKPGGSVPSAADPRVQHPFTDWRQVLTDRRAPLSVSASKPLPGAGGSCFAVDSTSASLSPPLDVGIYCYQADGTLTGARLAYGTLVLAGSPATGPATIQLPGPVVPGKPLGMKAPPPTTAPATPSPDATSAGG